MTKLKTPKSVAAQAPKESQDKVRISPTVEVLGEKRDWDFDAKELRVSTGNPQIQAKKIVDWILDKTNWTYGIMPSRNVGEWRKEFEEEVAERIGEAKAGKITANTLAEQVKSTAENMSAMVEDDEAEPDVTVIYSGEDDEPKTIGHYHDYTDGDFEAKWKSTDGWRGYFEVTSKDWVKVHDDCILSMSADADELHKFDETLQKLLQEKGIRYARVFARTSNVFSTGYDFFVEKGKATQAKMLAQLLALRYRDPARFRATALTGADPEQMTPHDKLFVKYASQIMEGKKTFAQIKKELGVKE